MTLMSLFGILARSGDSTGGGDDERDFPAALNRLAVVAFVGAALIAAAGLFAVPVLRDHGMTFRAAFAVVGVTEFSAAVVAAFAGYHLYSVPEQ